MTILVLMALIALNGVFAMAELAMMTSRQSRLQQMAERGSRSARVALALARDPNRFLSTVQVGITLIGIFAGAFGERALSRPIEDLIARIPVLAPAKEAIALAIVVGGITYLSLVFGELVPKRLALAYPEAIASAIARPLDLMSRIAAAPVKVLTVSTNTVLSILRLKHVERDEVSAEDLHALVSRAATTGVFTRHEHGLFQRLFRSIDLRAEAIMVPRSQIVHLEEDMALEQVRLIVGSQGFSQYPVCRGGLTEVIGVVHIKDLLAHGLLAGSDFKVVDIARPPIFIPETKRALELLDTFKANRTHMVFVVDEYGSVEGLVTLNDVVEALVGEVPRPGEPSSSLAVRRSDGSWVFDGGVPVHEAIGMLGIRPADEPHANTVAGLVLEALGRVPSAGESAEWGGYRFEVMRMDGHRVDSVLAVPLRKPESEPGNLS